MGRTLQKALISSLYHITNLKKSPMPGLWKIAAGGGSFKRQVLEEHMSIFDVLTNGSLGSVIGNIANQARSAASSLGGSDSSGAFGNIGNILETIADKAKTTATNIKDNTPGGVAGLAGAGALGALLGNVFSGDIMKSVALAGAGAVAYNFYKKWADGQRGQAGAASGQPVPQAAAGAPAGWGNVAEPSRAAQTPIDPTAELVMRAMIYAARADGTIDASEQNRIHQIMRNMLPGQNVDAAMVEISKEDIDPSRIAKAVISPEQGQDIFRLSCAVIDIDHFMEVSYLDALAKSLNIDDAEKKKLEDEAAQAKSALQKSIGQ